MSEGSPAVAPVLSTPDSHVFDNISTVPIPGPTSRLDDDELYTTYEIRRTVDEIRNGRWKRVALQFPDAMLIDAPRVYQALARGLSDARTRSLTGRAALQRHSSENGDDDDAAVKLCNLNVTDAAKDTEEQLFILADTSYGACCVDEVAAEHANADVVVHYGRSCLSPTARLPVIYCFTKPPLDVENVISVFKATYSELGEQVILMADIPYCSYLDSIADKLRDAGYNAVFVAGIVYDTASPLPNRTVPASVSDDPSSLSNWSLFHLSNPPESLLLTLASRVSAIHIYSTSTSNLPTSADPASSAITLRRRYALLTSLSTTAIFGILVNTLSVRNYLSMVEHVRASIAAAGKKSYTFVVGKVNAAKVANFAEVGGWVVVGCWESSLFDSRDFWKPVVTPFELELALTGDAERVWTGAWRSDFQAVLDESAAKRADAENSCKTQADDSTSAATEIEIDSEEESEPPEFDLRTGRYVSHSRPMRATRDIHTGGAGDAATVNNIPSNALIERVSGQLATVGGQVSPAAEFFKNKRSWQGLGSDYHNGDEELLSEQGAQVEQGRSGIARGYTVGEEIERH